MKRMIEQIRRGVADVLGADTSGHSMDHVDRVVRLAEKLSVGESVDAEIVCLIALLHDVDDYKLFGPENAQKLTNARRILDAYQVDDATKADVLESISTMGYNNYLDGKRPHSLEGQIVSDADMCDSIGAQGILRAFAYGLSKGQIFFDRELEPQTQMLTGDEYRTISAIKPVHSVQHFFDKILLIPGILMTDAGKREGRIRLDIMLDFLDELFREEDAANWQEHLQKFRSEIVR